MRSLIFSNLTTRKPAADAEGATIALPSLVVGQQWTIGTRFTQRVDGSYGETFPDIHSLRASIGKVDARPESGIWKMQVGPGASTEANTTLALNFNLSADRLKTALNALTGGAQDYEVEWDSGSYIVFRPEGQQIELQARANRLKPISMVRIREYQVDGEYRYEVRLIQAPLAFTDSAEQVLPKKPYIETVVDGYTDASGTYFQNEVQNLIIPAEFRGAFYIRRGLNRTQLLSEEDGIDEIQTNLNAMLDLEGGSVTVTNPQSTGGDGVARIEFGGDLAGINLDPLEIVVPPEGSPPGDWTITLDLNRAEVWAALRGQETVKVPFEFEARVYLDPEDHDAGTKVVKLWKEDVTITRALMWEGLATAQNIDWLRPPSPKTYVPFTLDQVLVGQQQAFSAVVGDDSATEFTLDHNLASELATVAVRENTVGGRALRPDEYGVAYDSDNSLTIDFSLGANPYGAPALDSIAVFVISIGPASAFQAHTNTVPQIVAGGGYPALADFMDDIWERVADLESYIPSISGLSTGTVKGTMTIDLPSTEEVLFYRGEETEFFGEKGLDLAKVPVRGPYMLPAIHDSTVDNVTAVPSSATGNAGKVYKNNASPDLLVSPGGRIRSETIAQDEFFGCDGRGFYKVTRDASTNSYHPTAFERELWMLFINDQMLRVGNTFEVQFGVKMLTALANSRAQWTLRIERGTAPQDTSPSPVGINLQNVIWHATPMLEQRLIITPLATTHFAGVRIKRAVAEMTADKMLYGTWEGNNANAPADGNFALRAVLTKFDTENSVTTAKGNVAYQLVASMGEDGATSTEAPKAIIY